MRIDILISVILKGLTVRKSMEEQNLKNFIGKAVLSGYHLLLGNDLLSDNTKAKSRIRLVSHSRKVISNGKVQTQSWGLQIC